MDCLQSETQFRQRISELGLNFRSAQWDMIQSAYQAFSHHQFACLEAPTGTGKTLAYTLAGLAAKKPKQYLVIATATTALQNQFMKQDIPLVEKLTGTDVSACVAKGRRQYICMAQLYQQPPALEGMQDQQVQFYRRAKSALERKQWLGDKDNAPEGFTEAIWQELTVGSSECLGSSCEFFNQCVFFKHKWQMTQSDVVVTNHNLLLSDFALGGGVVLPEPAKCLYVIDESHHFHEKALDHFARQTTLLKAHQWLNNFQTNLTRLQTVIQIDTKLIERVQEHVQHIVRFLKDLHQFYSAYLNSFDRDGILLLSEIEQDAQAIMEQVRTSSWALLQCLMPVSQRIENYLEDHKDKREPVDEQTQGWISHFHFLHERLEGLFTNFNQLLSVPDKQTAPMAKWLVKHETSEGLDLTVHTEPINAGQFLQEHCWEQMMQGAVLCSATLQTTNGFEDLLRKTGLKPYEPQCQGLPSSFDYDKSCLFVPSMNYEPISKYYAAYLDEAVPLLQKLLTIGQGHLVLFTSRQTMHDIYHLLPESYQDQILMQQQYSHQQLVTKHKQRIDQGKPSTLLGLLSLAEGLDLPGDYCEHVIIQKLPFSVPSDPVQRTRTQWLRFHNMDPFSKVALPEAGLKLKQFVGRLLRKETDKGIITVLDKRLYSKGYGTKLINCLPPFQHYIDESVDNVRQFL